MNSIPQCCLSHSLVDRTSELRKKGFEGRRLGPVQMTTDTAVRVTRLVAEGKSIFSTHVHSDFPDHN